MKPLRKHLELIALLLSLLLFSTGCSKDDDATFFTPPSWIQGDWIITSHEYLYPNLNGFEFTNNDFIMVNDEYRESQNLFLNSVSGNAVYATEQFSANNYIISMHYILTTQVYDFTPISASEISCSYKDIDYPENVKNVILTRR